MRQQEAPTFQILYPPPVTLPDGTVEICPATPLEVSSLLYRPMLSEEPAVCSMMMNWTRRFFAFIAGVTFGTSGFSWP